MLGMWDRGPHVNPIASDLGDSDGEYIRGIRGYTHGSEVANDLQALGGDGRQCSVMRQNGKNSTVTSATTARTETSAHHKESGGRTARAARSERNEAWANAEAEHGELQRGRGMHLPRAHRH